MKTKILVIILLLLSLAMIINSASAATIPINSSNDFKNTIENGENGTIFELNSSVNEFSLNVENVVISIENNITIKSSSPLKNAVINANKLGNVFIIEEGGSLTLINITIKNGFSRDGGAIANGGTLTLTGCTFISNTASYSGGAIENVNTLIANYCTFTNNVAIAECGGAISSGASVTLTACTFTGNIAKNDSGSAIWMIYEGNLIATACNFIGNTANKVGTVYNVYATVNLVNCIFTNNNAKTGSAIYNQEGTFTLTGCTFTSNIVSMEDGISNSGNGATQAHIYNYKSKTTLNKCNFLINPKLDFTSKISKNKLIITATAIDKATGQPIAGENIYFYDKGKKVGNATTNDKGVARFAYTLSKSGIHKFDVKINGFTYEISTNKYIYSQAINSKNLNIILRPAKIKLYQSSTSKAIKNKGKKLYNKVYKYKNSGQSTGSKKFTINIGKKFKLYGKVTKSTNVSYKYNKKTRQITVNIKNLAYNKVSKLNFKIIQV